MLRALMMLALVVVGAMLLLQFTGPPIPQQFPSWAEVVTTGQEKPEQVVLVAAVVLGWVSVALGVAYALSSVAASLSALARPARTPKVGANPKPGKEPKGDRKRKKAKPSDPQRSITLEVEDRRAREDDSVSRYG